LKHGNKGGGQGKAFSSWGKRAIKREIIHSQKKKKGKKEISDHEGQKQWILKVERGKKSEKGGPITDRQLRILPEIEKKEQVTGCKSLESAKTPMAQGMGKTDKAAFRRPKKESD